MLLDATADSVSVPKKSGISSYDLHAPALLQVYPRPRPYDETVLNRLYLWGPRASNAGMMEANLLPSDAAADLLATPLSPWPDTNDLNIRLPHLRFVDGRVAVVLKLTGRVAQFLAFDPKNKTLFGGLSVNLLPGDQIAATLVPEDIEFDGSLPDPARDFTGGTPSGHIEGRFGLECRTANGEPRYLLRLVHAEAQTMTATETRILQAFGNLPARAAPVAIRYDKRPAVPPLFWHLEAEPLTSTQSTLKLKPVAGNAADFEMCILSAAVDVRIRTQGCGEAESGLAAILVNSVIWRRTGDKTVEVEIGAGHTVPGPGDLNVTFRRE
ncbi:MAG: hypothetical protein MO852_06175 [Candidatus Devosia euplotis]|nr:hypothetical protein [Candidatus Devosia euplotis]